MSFAAAAPLSRLLRRLRPQAPLCVALAACLGLASHLGAAGLTNLTPPPPPPTSTGSHLFAGEWDIGVRSFSGKWYIAGWPRPTVKSVELPRARFQCLPVAAPADLRAVRTGPGEYYLLDGSGRLHVAPVQFPERQIPLDSPLLKTGESDFVVSGGVVFPGEDGLVRADPGAELIADYAEEPATTPVLPLIFTEATAVRPGLTYGYFLGAYSALPNTGLLLPRIFGESENAPLRAHTLHKIVFYQYRSAPAAITTQYVALGTLHPETPGYLPGTQALFFSQDRLSWTFAPLPAPGRWRDIAVRIHESPHPYAGQIVVVGDAGIYTSRSVASPYTSMSVAGPWKLIAANTTADNSDGLILTPPEGGADLPLANSAPLRLSAVAWAGDRFVAAGTIDDGQDSPVVVEGGSTFWFAYPLEGWPSHRTIDEIAVSGDRRLLLSRATGGEPALLVTNQPVYAPVGSAPVLAAPALFEPELGTRPHLDLRLSGGVTRYIIEGEPEAVRAWYMEWDGYLRHRGSLGHVVLPEPAKLRITPINEFGRGEPIEIEIRPKMPSPFPSNAAAPRISVPKQARIALGSSVSIPVKDLGPDWAPWGPGRTWFYGLPRGLSFDSHRKAITGHALEAGVSHVQVMAINTNGAGWAGPLVITVPEPRPQPADAGNFSGLLDGADALSGRWRVALRADRSFTGRLDLPGSAHAFRGKLSSLPGDAGLFAAELAITRGKRLEPVSLKLVLDAGAGRLALHVRSGDEEAATAGETVSRAPWAADRLCPRSGGYTARIAPPASEDGGEPAGAGFFSLTVFKSGTASLCGNLANGVRWTNSSTVSASGSIPLFWKSGGQRSLRGVLAFSPDEPEDNRFEGSLSWRTGLNEKCPAYGPAAELHVLGNRTAVYPIEEPIAYAPVLVFSHPELARYGFPDGRAEIGLYRARPDRLVTLLGGTPALRPSLRLNMSRGTILGDVTLTGPGGKKLRVALQGVSLLPSGASSGELHGYFLLPSADGRGQVSGAFRTDAGR